MKNIKQHINSNYFIAIQTIFKSRLVSLGMKLILCLLIFSSEVKAQDFQKIFDCEEIYQSAPYLEYTIMDLGTQEETNSTEYDVKRTTYVGLRYTRDHKTDVQLESSDDSWSYEIVYAISGDNDISKEYTLKISNDFSNPSVYEARNNHEHNLTRENILIKNVYFTENEVKSTISAAGFLASGKSKDIELYIGINRERHWRLNPSVTPVINLSNNTINNTLNITWSEIKGAQEYDLEWTYIDANESEYGIITGSNKPDAIFKYQEPTRVRVQNNQYNLNLNYGEGMLFFRVRSVGRYIVQEGGKADFSSIKTGDWSSDISSHPINAAFESDKNWTYAVTFAENGKHKSVINYFDEGLKSRQTLTNFSSKNITVAAETKYNFEGVQAVSVLPAPLQGRTLTYQSNLNQVGGNPFSAQHFDQGVANRVLPSTTSEGAAKYFSENNSFTSDPFRDRLPDLEGYVYSQVKYESDGTGRIKSQGGIGKDFAIGSDHETKYYYGTPNQTELHKLFGTNVGNSSHYKKNMVVDPNGQASIAYIDQEGRTIATALAGKAPNQLEKLQSNIDAENLPTITVNIDSNNVLDKENLKSVTTHSIINTIENNEYTFTYDYTGVMYNLEGCNSCKYQLTIYLEDEKGNLIKHISKEISDVNSTCNNINEEGEYGSWGTPHQEKFTVNLPEVGTYTIHKELAVITEEINPTQTTGLFVDQVLWERLINKHTQKINCSECAIDCEEHAFANAISEYFSKDEPISDNSEISNTDIFEDFGCMALWEFLNKVEEAKDENSYFITIVDGMERDDWISLYDVYQIKREECNDVLDYALDTFSVDIANGCESKLMTLKSDIHPDNEYYSDEQFRDNVENKGLLSNLNQAFSTNYTLNDLWSLTSETFKDEYQDVLVEAHIEYCHYENCKYDATYDNYMNTLKNKATSWDEAKANGFASPVTDMTYTNGIGGVPHLDNNHKIFEDDENQADWLTELNNYYNHEGTIYSIWGEVDRREEQMEQWNEEFNGWEFYVASYGKLRKEFIQTKREETCPFIENGHYTEIDFASQEQIDEQSNADNYAYTTNYEIGQIMFQNTEEAIRIKVNEWMAKLFSDCNGTYNQVHYDHIKSKLTTYAENIDLGFNPYMVIRKENLSEEGSILKSLSSYISDQNVNCNGTLGNNETISLESLLPDEENEITYEYLLDEDGNPVMQSYYVFEDHINEFVELVNSEIYNKNNPWNVTPDANVTTIPSGSHYDEYDYLAIKSWFTGTQHCQCPWNDMDEIPYNSLILWGNQENYCSDVIRVYPENTTQEISPDHIRNLGKITPDGTGRYFSTAKVWYGNGFSVPFHLKDVKVQVFFSSCLGNIITEKQYPIITKISTEDFENDPISIFQEECSANLIETAQTDAIQEYYEIIQQRLTADLQAKFENCFAFDKTENKGHNESFKYSYKNQEYHYTLYYYDQAGNLVQTVPPAGVEFTDASAFDTEGNYDGVTEPEHRLNTRYKYNSLNQITYQSTPDGGESWFYYNDAGQLRFSQNARQKERTYNSDLTLASTRDKSFSYTKYNSRGEVIETGQSDQFCLDMQCQNTIALEDAVKNSSFPFDNLSTNQVTRIKYDKRSGIHQSISGNNLRGRIAEVEFLENGGQGTLTSATVYDYSVEGVVDNLYQKNYDLAAIGHRTKTINYEYDLISGNVNEVHYQDGELDQFHHKYHYNEDNQITKVQTSNDGMIYNTQAKYLYNATGMLMRTELGDQIQGIDYLFNGQGWMMGVNSRGLTAAEDLGADGDLSAENSKNSNFAKDAFGYALGYFKNAYKPIASSIRTNRFMSTSQYDEGGVNFGSSGIGQELFNGNIAYTVMSNYNQIEKDDQKELVKNNFLNAYRYDQLNRLVAAREGTVNQFSLDVNSSYTAQTLIGNNEVQLKYDANGNIKTLKRRAEDELMDDFEYKYAYEGNTTDKLFTNRLYHVNEKCLNNDVASNDIDFTVNHGNITMDDILTGSINPNYAYDAAGNLIADASEEIAEIKWTVDGKVSEVIRTATSKKPDLEFKYGPDRNRIAKIVKSKNDQGTINNNDQWKQTYYVRDAQGNVMAIYDLDYEPVSAPDPTRGGNQFAPFTFKVKERNGYGTSRLFVDNEEQTLIQGEGRVYSITDGEFQVTGIDSETKIEYTFNQQASRKVGFKTFELSNHLGNVLTTVTDRKFYNPGPDAKKLSFANGIEDFISGGTTPEYDIINKRLKISTAVSNQGAYRWIKETDANYPIEAKTKFNVNFTIDKEVNANGSNYLVGFEAWAYYSGDDDVNLGHVLISQEGQSTHSLSFTVPDDYEGIYIKYYLSTNETGELQTFYLENVEIYQDGYYVAEITSGKQYWPFGMEVEEYSWSNGGTRNTFQGQEKDEELWGGSSNYKYRMNDPRIGRFFAVDPLAHEFPWNSPYAFSENSVIAFVELEGLEKYYAPTGEFLFKRGDSDDDRVLNYLYANWWKTYSSTATEAQLKNFNAKLIQKSVVAKMFDASTYWHNQGVKAVRLGVSYYYNKFNELKEDGKEKSGLAQAYLVSSVILNNLATGTGQRNFTFDGSHGFAKMLNEDNRLFKEVVKDFEQKLEKTNMKANEVLKNGGSFGGGYEFSPDHAGIWESVKRHSSAAQNPIELIVGGMSYTLTGVFDQQTGDLTGYKVVFTNISGKQSLLLHKATDVGDHPVPLGDVKQTITYTISKEEYESIKKDLDAD